MGSCCSTPQQQQATKRKTKKKKSNNNNKPPPIRHGADGLLDLGFEYRFLPCSKHRHDTGNNDDEEGNGKGSSCGQQEEQSPHQQLKPSSSTTTTSCTTCMECSHRLFRIMDDVMITTTNRKQHIPGRIYDQLAPAAQQEVAKWLQRDYKMVFLPTFEIQQEEKNANTKEQKQQKQQKQKQEEKSSSVLRMINTLVTMPVPSNTTTSSTSASTLVIINGRGIARAGILSTRHTVESGVEKGSAMFHIQQARQRHWDVVCLDSNARKDPTKGLDTVCRSLSSPALQPYLTSGSGRKLYFLCHSAAGGNLVQYLLKEDCALQLDQIQALVFTDSTHDLQWLSLQQNPTLKEFVQSSKCLYIRNNREHKSDTFGPNHKYQKAGEPYNNSSDPHWIKRFGTIQTVYAGTTDHSLMCYTARNIIWDFFDEKQKCSENNTPPPPPPPGGDASTNRSQ